MIDEAALNKATDSLRRQANHNHSAIAEELAWSRVLRSLTLGLSLSVVSLFLPWAHEAERAPNHFNVFLGFGAVMTALTAVVATAVIFAESPNNSSTLLLATSGTALVFLIVGLLVGFAQEDHVGVGPGGLLAALGCGAVAVAATSARQLDNYRSRG